MILLAHAELAGLVCGEAIVDGEHTYALMGEHVPAPRRLGRTEALAELALRYSSSRRLKINPATATVTPIFRVNLTAPRAIKSAESPPDSNLTKGQKPSSRGVRERRPQWAGRVTMRTSQS